eukprot:447500-Alexandrium_andersonii.AAC.1
MCLQEAHGRPVDQGARARLLPAVVVASSLGRAGPGGGVQGGVAVRVPAPRRLLGQRELVPGCA